MLKNETGGVRFLSLIVIGIIGITLFFWNQDDKIETQITSGINNLDGNNNSIESNLEIRFIDVGQGDACLVMSDGYNILIDGGDNNKRFIVKDYLTDLGIEKIDMIIATHPHADHIGGLDYVIENFEVDRVLMPEIPEKTLPTTVTFYEFLEAMDKKGITPEFPKANDVYKFGRGEFVILDTYEEYNNLNDYSIVSKFTYDNEVSTLFTGDCEDHKEEDLLINYNFKDFKSDILKVGHHGSSSSTTREFYEAVDPQFCVISCGLDNRYGHPHQETLKTIETNDAKIFRTDLQGSITMGLSEDGIYVETEK